MVSGPTQNYDDATLGAWKPHPILAGTVRLLTAVAPLVLAIAFGMAATRWVPPQRIGMNPWLWLVCEIALATVLLLLAARALRRLLPLSTLLRLTLYFPDRAPSRLAVARRTFSPDTLRERMEQHRANGTAPDVLDGHAEILLGLVASLNAHDRATLRHSERVQAYTALIAKELGLPPSEVVQLSWAALLHDVGKIHVPSAILNKSGKPSTDEWELLSAHPSHGAALAAPLAGWLGPWLGAIDQHHERWDGGGYPRGLAGEDISRAARIVGVADAFDVITTARAYKKPLSAAAARTELARCAGRQFDPEVVRAFLAVGLGRLHTVAGPISVLSALPGLRSMPVHDVSTTLATVANGFPAAGGAATATVAAAALTFASPAAVGPQTALALDDEVQTVAEDRLDRPGAPQTGGVDGAEVQNQAADVTENRPSVPATNEPPAGATAGPPDWVSDVVGPDGDRPPVAAGSPRADESPGQGTPGPPDWVSDVVGPDGDRPPVAGGPPSHASAGKGSPSATAPGQNKDSSTPPGQNKGSSTPPGAGSPGPAQPTTPATPANGGSPPGRG